MTESIAPEEHRDEQAAQAGKNLIQVGRDYVRYIVFQFDSGHWGVAAANLGVLLLMAGGLVNGLLGGASFARSWVNPPQPQPTPVTGGACCLPATSHFEKLDARMARLEKSLSKLAQANLAKPRSTQKSVAKPTQPQPPSAWIPRRPRVYRIPRRPLPLPPQRPPRYPERPTPKPPVPPPIDTKPYPDPYPQPQPEPSGTTPGTTNPGNGEPSFSNL